MVQLPGPVPALREGTGRLPHRFPFFPILDQRLNRRGEFVRVPGLDQVSRDPRHDALPDATGSRTDHREPGRHRLERHEPAGLGRRGKHEEIGIGVQLGQPLPGQEAEVESERERLPYGVGLGACSGDAEDRGFTNRRIWDEYGVHAPVWGYVYDRTLHDLAAPFPLAAFAEPKIEPEIMLGLSRAPSPAMDDAALLTCIDWVAHGYEIVQSIYPGWKFAPPDAVIVDGHHGALLIGPRHEIGAKAVEWLRTLTSFEIELFCDGKLMDKGHALNVLEGPVSTLRYLIDLLARDPDNPPLAAGEIISTGTLTRALPVKPGETWTTKLNGIALEGASLRFE